MKVSFPRARQERCTWFYSPMLPFDVCKDEIFLVQAR